MGPFTAIDGNGNGWSYSKMMNGRPADSHYFTQFFAPGYTRNLESLETLTHVGGMQAYSSQSKGGSMHGHGKKFLTNGRIFIGKFIQHKMSEGKLYEIQKDKTYTLYQVKYDSLSEKDSTPSN